MCEEDYNKDQTHYNNTQKPIDKWAALIIVSIILAGSYLYVQENKLSYNKAQDEKRQDLKNLDALRRDDCLSAADVEYSSLWDSNCKGRKLKNNCALPIILSDRIDKTHKEAREECIKMYPSN